jgi:hypothetical protein
MQVNRPVWFVHDRFEELRALLELWGWEIAERGDLSEWDEGRREDPVLGLVRIRGTKQLLATDLHVSFTVKEWWAHPPADGPLERQGHVLAGYHYTAQSMSNQVRHCFDRARHPDEPSHRHPTGGPEIVGEAPISVESALVEFEERLAEELAELDGIDLADFDVQDEDSSDAVFGEADT